MEEFISKLKSAIFMAGLDEAAMEIVEREARKVIADNNYRIETEQT